MLLPDNVQPELSIYYNGSLVLKKLKKKDNQLIINLYQIIKVEQEMSFPVFVLILDWLYLIDAAKINEMGYVKLCL